MRCVCVLLTLKLTQQTPHTNAQHSEHMPYESECNICISFILKFGLILQSHQSCTKENFAEQRMGEGARLNTKVYNGKCFNHTKGHGSHARTGVYRICTRICDMRKGEKEIAFRFCLNCNNLFVTFV